LSSLQQERDELAETNSNLWRKVADLEQEIQRWDKDVIKTSW